MPDAWFDRGVAFALDALARPGTKVLSHCHMGINRGPSLAYAVLLALGTDPVEALDALRRARPIANAWYAEDALDWWHRRSGAPETVRHSDRRRVAAWRAAHPLDVVRIIADRAAGRLSGLHHCGRFVPRVSGGRAPARHQRRITSMFLVVASPHNRFRTTREGVRIQVNEGWFERLADVMARMADGDTAALEVLYIGFGDPIRSLIRKELRRLGVTSVDPADVDGLTLDVCTDLFRRAGSWDPSHGVPPGRGPGCGCGPSSAATSASSPTRCPTAGRPRPPRRSLCRRPADDDETLLVALERLAALRSDLRLRSSTRPSTG